MLKMIVNGVTYRAKALWGLVNRIFYQKPKVLDTRTSLRLILDKKCSVARFGDGEFNIMRGGHLVFRNRTVLLQTNCMRLSTKELMV